MSVVKPALLKVKTDMEDFTSFKMLQSIMLISPFAELVSSYHRGTRNWTVVVIESQSYVVGVWFGYIYYEAGVIR